MGRSTHLKNLDDEFSIIALARLDFISDGISHLFNNKAQSYTYSQSDLNGTAVGGVSWNSFEYVYKLIDSPLSLFSQTCESP